MNYQIVMAQLPLVRETPASTSCRQPADVLRACIDMATMAQESQQALTIDGKNRILNRHMISLGLADACLIHPREVFRAAILDNASAVVLVHNHPSGETTPSGEDIRLTKQIVEAGRILDIKVLDHIIIGRDAAGVPSCLSMREQGLISFT